MEDSKSWYMSKTVWATLLLVIVSILRIIGRPEAEAIEVESAGIAEWIVQVVTVVLAAIAFLGRITAKTKLTT